LPQCLSNVLIAPNPYMHLHWSANSPSASSTAMGRPALDPEVRSLIRTIHWHLSLGPQNVSRWHPLLDRRLFTSPPINYSPPSLVHSPILIRVYTPGRRLPGSYSSHLTLRLYPYARVRDLFYEISDALAGVVESDRVTSLSEDEQRSIAEAQRWRVAECFTEIGTTFISVIPRSESQSECSDGGGLHILLADFLNGDFVISDLTPVDAPETSEALALNVLFKAR